MNDNQLLEVIVGELKELVKEQREQGKTLAAQAEVLKDHTRRSTLNEENLEMLRSEIKPVQKHVAFVETVLKICGAIVGLAGFTLIIIEIVVKVASF